MDNPHVIVLERVDSTNNYALRLAKEGRARHGMVICADYQTSGRGRGMRSWAADPGSNLTISVILSPTGIGPSGQFIISKAVSVGLTDYLERKAPGLPWSIKWPNDIYCGRMKVAGILIENLITGNRIDFSVVGIGLNLNQEEFAAELPDAVSLRTLTAKVYERDDELPELLRSLSASFRSSPRVIDERYRKRLYRAGIASVFQREGREFTATIEGVNGFGMLSLRMQDGSLQEFGMDEIVLVEIVQ